MSNLITEAEAPDGGQGCPVTGDPGREQSHGTGGHPACPGPSDQATYRRTRSRVDAGSCSSPPTPHQCLGQEGHLARRAWPTRGRPRDSPVCGDRAGPIVRPWDDQAVAPRSACRLLDPDAGRPLESDMRVGDGHFPGQKSAEGHPVGAPRCGQPLFTFLEYTVDHVCASTSIFSFFTQKISYHKRCFKIF